MLKFKKFILCIFVISIIVVLIKFNTNTIDGAINGMILCAQRVIPSLFPFTVFTLFLYNGNYFDMLFSKIKRKDQMVIFLISCLGGYPIGAKLISEAYNKKKISRNDAENMLCYSINAGPAFTISVIGNLIFRSEQLGIIIYLASVLSAFELLLIFGKRQNSTMTSYSYISFTDNFVNSVASAAEAMITVCGFVVLFSGFVNVIKVQVKNIIIKNSLIAFLEVTTAVNEIRNVYIISFLVGFSGLSIIMQILSISNSYKPNLLKILISRIFNGIFMVINVTIFLKIFKTDIITISNGHTNSLTISQGNLIFSVLFIISCICLIYSLKTKKYCGNLRKDIF